GRPRRTLPRALERLLCSWFSLLENLMVVVCLSCLWRAGGDHQSGEESLSNVGEGGKVKSAGAADATANASGPPKWANAATRAAELDTWLTEGAGIGTGETGVGKAGESGEEREPAAGMLAALVS